MTRSRQPFGAWPRRVACSGSVQKRGRAAVEKDAVPLLVGGMEEVQPAEQRIGSQLRGAEQIAPAVGLGLAEAEQLLHASLGIAPDPAVNRLQEAVH